MLLPKGCLTAPHAIASLGFRESPFFTLGYIYVEYILGYITYIRNIRKYIRRVTAFGGLGPQLDFFAPVREIKNKKNTH